MLNKKRVLILSSIIFLFVIISPFLSAEKNIEDVIQDLNIKIDGTNVLRSGNEIIIRPIIFNENSNESIDIKQIKFLTSNKKEVDNIELNKNIRPIKYEFAEAKSIYNLQHKLNRPELTLRYNELIPIIQQGIFAKGFTLDIRDFDSDFKIGENVTIQLEIKIKYNNQDYILERNHTILISEPLPSLPHHSPGWYAGAQHIHSNWSGNIIDGYDIPPIFEMVSESKSEDLEWTIFTDHSDSDFMSSSVWSIANAQCNNEDIGSFECIYGQELALDAPGIFCNRRHYLAYDATPSYIDASCVASCWCEDAQDKVDELNSNGGYGFIAHPHTTSTIIDWEDWSITGFTGLELINSKDGAFESDDSKAVNNPGGQNDSWRELLQSETNLNNGFTVGIAGNDAHSLSDLGNTISYCYLDSLSQTNIVNSIKNGHCIASTGPFVQFTIDGHIIGDSITVPTGTNTIDITASSTAEFGQLEWLRIYVNDGYTDYPLSGYFYSNLLDIDLTTDWHYVRMEVYTRSDRRGYTNPIWLNVTSCSCGSWSVGSCGTGGCGFNQKPWTRSCSPSGCATESQCVYDASCEEENPPIEDCEESGYEFCIEADYEACTVSIAENLYTNVNNIQWGAVNDAWDPYVIGNYTVGWKDVDAEKMYYDCDGNNDCDYGGCDCDRVNDEDTRITVTAPGTAHHEEILGYDDTAEQACWVWWNSFNPNYGASNPIYVLNCFNDNDCSSVKYCNKTGSWSSWACVNKKSNGQSCTSTSQCSSGYCDNDGVGLIDDGWCFTPYNTYFDGQETSYCEYSTNFGNSNCDERQVGEDLNLCLGTSYYEEECSSTCEYQNITSVFECTEAGCGCTESFCDGLTIGNNITTCSSEETYFADKCTSAASGEDRGDNICRNSSFASGCTADSECNGVIAGTGNCSSTCNLVLPDTHKFYVKTLGYTVAWFGNLGNIALKGICFNQTVCTAPSNSFIIANNTDNTTAYIDNSGNLCIEKGDCSDLSATCNPMRNAFIIRNLSNHNMSYIDFDGDLCLIGNLYQNSSYV